MADSDETTTPRKRRARSTTKKTVKKTAKKTTKKTAKKSAKKSAKRAAKKTASAPTPQAGTGPAEKKETFDRSQLGEKTRVFVLAKMLGMTSKDLVVKLNELGLVKVAQSSLSKAETEQVLDALEAAPTGEADNAEPTTADADSPVEDSGASDEAEAAETEAAEAAEAAEEKIRHRVRKDVENEINQIEEKVEADLLTDIEPEVTPVPTQVQEDVEETAGLYAPVFKAAPRGSKRRARRTGEASISDAPKSQEAATDDEEIQEPKAIKGSSRLEAQRRRRSERREEERKRSRVVSQAEFLARRESVERTMVVRERPRHDGPGSITQVGVLEDGLLVEHFVDSDENASMIGNIYLGRVQNVLPSMEAAFIDIGQGRNGVLYAGEVDWKAAGLGGRSRRIEQALKSGDQVLVQVTKDPVGHKGARLTTQISLAGRFLVYVPGGRSAGISRKLPAPERKRLKDILVRVVPGKGGTIIRTAAEGAPEEAIAADVNRLHSQWEAIQEEAEKEKSSKGAKPVTLYEEPRLLVKVVRDLFNEDFDTLVVDGKKSWNVVHNYVQSVAPDLLDRLEKFDRRANDGRDAFDVYRVDEQIQKALSRTVWLPSGGTLVIDRTEAMTVIDVNTGKFTGSGGSLEETVTSNNLEAAEEIVRQLRLRDIGGMIIIDFIDMILPENQDLVLRRLKEALGRDRTRHQVSEVTSLGLVQLTRKRLGTGLVETFSTKCEHCDGRGIVLTDDPVDPDSSHPFKQSSSRDEQQDKGSGKGSKRRRPAQDPGSHPAALSMKKNVEEQSEEGSETNVEELIDAVVASPDAHDDENVEQKRRSSRRRGRRGSGRGKGRARDGQQETPSSATEQTYEEALEEFENSPRRKRRTRGNSTSDHPPRPEDFQQESQDSQESPEPAAEEKQERRTSAKRGRRRASRRSSAQLKETMGATQTAETVETQPSTSNKPAAPSRSGRGRRRATRKRQ